MTDQTCPRCPECGDTSQPDGEMIDGVSERETAWYRCDSDHEHLWCELDVKWLRRSESEARERVVKLEAALTQIQTITSRRSLPITVEINNIAAKHLRAALTVKE